MSCELSHGRVVTGDTSPGQLEAFGACPAPQSTQDSVSNEEAGDSGGGPVGRQKMNGNLKHCLSK